MSPTLAFSPSPEDFEEDFFGVPVIVWQASALPKTDDEDVKPPSPEPRTVAPVAAR
jgi:hypothetical protein